MLCKAFQCQTGKLPECSNSTGKCPSETPLLIRESWLNKKMGSRESCLWGAAEKEAAEGNRERRLWMNERASFHNMAPRRRLMWHLSPKH